MSHFATNWAILQRGLKPATKIVLWHLCDRHNPDFGCFPTQARLAADCDRAGISYLCEIMPVESARFPDAAAADAIAAACRAGQEIGAHAIKTTMPNPPSTMPASAACGVPVILAGGAVAGDRAQLFKDVATAMQGGAAGVAFGRNVWASADPAATVRQLVEIVHGTKGH